MVIVFVYTVNELIDSILQLEESYVAKVNPLFGMPLYGFLNPVTSKPNVVPAVLAALFVIVSILVVVS